MGKWWQKESSSIAVGERDLLCGHTLFYHLSESCTLHLFSSYLEGRWNNVVLKNGPSTPTVPWGW